MKNKMEVIGNIYQAGVYGMKVVGTEGYLYLGSGIEINDCLSRHTYFLKRGLYEDTNKSILQEKYDLGILVFEVIKESENSELVKDMSAKQKESLQIALGTLEQFYISLYKDTACNKQKGVTKHSSNKDEFSTIKRSKSNTGSNNPNSRYTEEIISNILWLKIEGYKAKEIMGMLKDQGIDIRSNYINQLGLTKWIKANAKKPMWINEKVVSFGEDTTENNTISL
ncbi:hypothetical protein [Clostridium estertheticum]|uniref:hypothetical protein n=1 Tax=Clostridium estertheticum TaxID=238834 RepID=UPI001CF144CE|nr:hypothetical protein [Clostridium estertheticum]MCB2340885.1 hypothetical protein [Clostridium estertheticum]